MLLLDRRYLASFDWISLLISLTLATIGVIFVFSATYKPEEPYSLFFKKQLFGLLSGFIIYCLFCFTDFRTLTRWGYFAYYGVILLLIFTIIKGSIGMGGQRWINLGFIKFQPSELAKLLFPAYAIYYLYTGNNQQRLTMHDFMPVLIMLSISFFLIRKQPDLGTALILLFSAIILLWLAGINRSFFIITMSIGCIGAPLVWSSLKEYQKQRILVFLGHGDVRKERYQLEQSKIAIGSGGLWGKGFLQGTQNKLNFLPESRTDFIFSVIAEETGLCGTLCILLLYIILFVRLLTIITTIRSLSIQLLALGVIIHIMLSTLINIGMVIGLLPIVGIPLPFISYGLSNLWITFASLGWFNSIAMRRFYINNT